MPERPLVSVVIPTRDRRHLVSRAIASVRAQTYAPIEIIVVDDGSTDGTVEDLETQHDIILVRLPESVGGAAARNRGIESASGEFVAFLDSDDEWLPEKLSHQVAVIEQDERVGAVYSRHYTHDHDTGVRREHRSALYTGHILPQLLSGRCPRTVSLFLVRNEALRRAGGFDESLRGFQDTDLWIRLASDWLFDAVDQPLVIVHDHPAPRITTDINARISALNGFLDKWGDSMAEHLGAANLDRYRRDHLAVAQGAVVLSAVRSGQRREAFGALLRYFSFARFSKPRQFTGLVIATIAGDGPRRSLKRLQQKRGR